MGSKPKGKLTLRRQAFVDAYVGEAQGNATEAYRLAGYAVRNDRVAEASAHKLLRNSEVANAIACALQPIREHAIATREERQTFLSRVMRGEVKGSEIKDRLKAADLLAKMQGDYITRAEISGPNGAPIKTMSLHVVTQAIREEVLGLSTGDAIDVASEDDE